MMKEGFEILKFLMGSHQSGSKLSEEGDRNILPRQVKAFLLLLRMMITFRQNFGD